MCSRGEVERKEARGAEGYALAFSGCALSRFVFGLLGTEDLGGVRSLNFSIMVF